MVKINYFHEVLLSERNTCLPNVIISHPKRQRNIPQNQVNKEQLQFKLFPVMVNFVTSCTAVTISL